MLSDRTSLHYVSENGNDQVVRTLVDLGADVNAKDKEYFSEISTSQ